MWVETRSFLALVAAFAVWGSRSTASAREPLVDAALTCRAEAAPGRVLCELRVSPRAGVRLTWVDALVTATPEFARPLRSRVAAARSGGDGAGERKLNLAFVATGSGIGSVRVTARAVVCRGAAAPSECRTESLELSAEIRVGSPAKLVRIRGRLIAPEHEAPWPASAHDAR